MVKLCSARLLVLFGGLGLSLTAGIGVASAGPDIGPLINTTCNYSQVVAALQANAPDMANALSANPQAQAGLRQFLALTPDQRRQYVNNPQQVTLPDIPQPLLDVIRTCNSY
jgi:hemophore-related protein